ncbi:inorganic polyphosphate/ATP-NAD kinase [Salinisphaera orenii MK-B5]|uniref:NAD kinase n=1 Tax=Salinisphaera orenii MK-B5 TaxID=856730 RepID=A0A423PTS1_9GAMM|nr:NAD(+) kinase [Salinisphaera orenii]ROO29006.1 inorganic polyphosphate/ATP-NAD kinase [Salinisphaera orenii MK-B5]
MAHEFATIGIFAKRHDETVRDTLDTLVAVLARHGRRVLADAEQADGRDDVEACPRDALGAACDLIVVVGGDGTLLDAGRTVAAHATPLLGVNLGRLGFMVDVLPADMAATLDDVFAGHYIAESRLMLGARIQRADGHIEPEVFPALNECVVRNQAFARVLDFDTYMNGDFISHHRADGMVVATPTGSTAYALSGGGPVLHPDMAALAMVPICPHTLSDRPLIVDAAHRVEVRVADGHDGAALFTSDGQVTQPLEPGDRVLIERGDHDLRLIHPPGYDYFNILRNKLQWGRGQQLPRA